MAAKKSKKKSKEHRPLGRGTAIPVASGGVLYAGKGNGPKKGAPNAGRPRNEWKLSLQALADRDEVLEHVNAALLAGPRRPKLDEDGKEMPIVVAGRVVGYEMTGSQNWEWAMDYVTEHGYGKAVQAVDVTSNGNTLEALLAASRLP